MYCDDCGKRDGHFKVQYAVGSGGFVCEDCINNYPVVIDGEVYAGKEYGKCTLCNEETAEVSSAHTPIREGGSTENVFLCKKCFVLWCEDKEAVVEILLRKKIAWLRLLEARSEALLKRGGFKKAYEEADLMASLHNAKHFLALYSGKESNTLPG